MLLVYRSIRTSARRLKDAAPQEVKGIPYSKLSIGRYRLLRMLVPENTGLTSTVVFRIPLKPVAVVSKQASEYRYGTFLTCVGFALQWSIYNL